MIRNFSLGFRHQDLDVDGDGLVTVEELVQKTGWSEEEATEFISAHDKNGDGMLSLAEFRAIERKGGLDFGIPRRGTSPDGTPPTDGGTLTMRARRVPGLYRLNSITSSDPSRGATGADGRGESYDGKGGGGYVSLEQFDRLNEKTNLLLAMLRKTLQQSKQGKKALEEIDAKVIRRAKTKSGVGSVRMPTLVSQATRMSTAQFDASGV